MSVDKSQTTDDGLQNFEDETGYLTFVFIFLSLVADT